MGDNSKGVKDDLEKQVSFLRGLGLKTAVNGAITSTKVKKPITLVKTKCPKPKSVLPVVSSTVSESSPVLVSSTEKNDPVIIIVRAVTLRYGVKEEEIWMENRGVRRISMTRQIVMYLLREVAGFSYPEVGRALHRNYLTVFYGCKVVEERRLQDSVLNKELEELEFQLVPLTKKVENF